MAAGGGAKRWPKEVAVRGQRIHYIVLVPSTRNTISIGDANDPKFFPSPPQLAAVARAAPDGYTLLMCALTSHAVNAVLYGPAAKNGDCSTGRSAWRVGAASQVKKMIKLGCSQRSIYIVSYFNGSILMALPCRPEAAAQSTKVYCVHGF